MTSTQHGNGFPDIYTQIIRACGERKDLDEAKRIHAHISRGEDRQNRYLSNLLIQMYGKCGSMEYARSVFDALSYPNVYSWTIIIAAYARNGHLYEAKRMYDIMPDKDVVSCNSIMALYSQRGELQMARKLFNSMPTRDTTSWNTMITAYAQNGHLHEARKLFDEMPERDVITWNAIMTAYSQCGSLHQAREMLESIPETNVVTWNAMLTAYIQAGDFADAKVTFDRMQVHDAVSCTAMITGYSQLGKVKEAREMFDMIEEKDLVSWNSIVAAFAQNNQVDEAMRLFQQMPYKDLVSWNAMITSFAQSGRIHEARNMFERMPRHNIVSWSALVSGYAQNGMNGEAFNMFRVMDLEGVQPNEVTFVSVLDACASSTASLQGRLVHEDVAAAGLPLNVEIGNALLDMYGKCGKISQAKRLFDGMPFQDEISWTAMIAAYSEVKLPDEALKLVSSMSVSGVHPNAVTYVGILSACSHQGSVANALSHFARMVGDYSVAPVMDHYKCVIDVLGRAGRVLDAEELVDCMPFQPDLVAWVTLLSACKTGRDEETSVRASKVVMELDSSNVSSFVLVSNTLAGKL